MYIGEGYGGFYLQKTYIPIIYLFNLVSDLQLQWQLNQSVAQSEVGLKQSQDSLK